MADRAQHRQVGRRVGVGPRLAEVDALAAGDLADRFRLAIAVRERAVGAAGVDTAAHFGARADAAVEHEHGRQQLGNLL